MTRRQALLLIAGMAVAGLCALVFLDSAHRPDFSDFNVYWTAGSKAASHRTVYDIHGHYQFKYSPFVALLWAVPTLLPGSQTFWQWLHYGLSGAGFLVVWFVLARALASRRALALWLVTIAIFAVGLRDELKLGQANFWPFLLVLPTFLADSQPKGGAKRDFGGLAIGALWGLAIQWKLYALILAPVWLLRRRPLVWVGALVIMPLTLVLAVGLAHGFSFALDENLRWLRSLSASSERMMFRLDNVSLPGILGKWGGQRHGGGLAPWILVVWAAAGLLWAVVLYRAERAAKAAGNIESRFWSAAWAWAGVVVLNPLVWPYWLLLCVPLFMAYAVRAWPEGARLPGAAFWLTTGLFAAANWMQNTKMIRWGPSLVATLWLMVEAYRRWPHRDPVTVVAVKGRGKQGAGRSGGNR